MEGDCQSCGQEDEVRGFAIDGELLVLCEDCVEHMEWAGCNIEGSDEAFGED